MKTGEKIRLARIMKGFSQENMAAMIGISRLAYGDIERGKTKPDKNRIEQIAKKMGVTTEDIEGLEETFAIFFDQCNGNNIGINNGTANNYDTRELQHKLDKALLENEKLNLKVEKAELEAKYWREKAEGI